MVRTLYERNSRWGPWVAGRERPSAEREVGSVVSPADGAQLAQVEQATSADVDEVIAVAHEAFQQHRFATGHQRAAWLRASAAALRKCADELSAGLIDVLGKPRKMAVGEVDRGIDLLDLCAEEIARFGGETIPLDAVSNGKDMWGLTRREPYGVVAAITPFNAPVNLLLQKVAPALATGNAVVVKPAPEGAIAALQVAEALAGVLPDGLLNVINGDAEAARELSGNALVRAVSLTGGVAAGESVMQAAGIKPVLLELGSNAPNVVADDADLDDAATRIAGAAFGASGQQCISAQRIIVDTAVFDEFSACFIAAARELVVGDPRDTATDLGPLVSERRKLHIDRYLDDAEARGGRILLDGRRKDLFYGPTIVADLPPESLLRCDEVFGPVAVLIEVDSFDEAIAVANDSELGLQAACFTRSLARAMQAAERIEAGTVLINQASRFRIDLYPFGGYKKSGIGREGVRSAMEGFSQIKTVAIRPLE